MKVQDILTDESKWTQRRIAADIFDLSTLEIRSRKAARFCLYGAILKAYRKSQESKAVAIMVCHKIKTGLIEWNDAPERTFAEVRGLIVELDI